MSAADLLADECIERYPEEAARVLERLAPEEVAALLEELTPARGAALLARLAPGFAAAALEVTPRDPAAEATRELHPNAAAQVLRRMEEGAATEVLARLPAGFGDKVRRLLAHPPDRAGALADAGALALPEDQTAREAARAIRARPDSVRHYLYVLTRDGSLLGAVDPVALLAAERGAPLDDLARREVPRLAADDDLAAVAYHPGWAEWRALAVVERDGRFVGAIGQELAQKLRMERLGSERSALELSLSFAELLWLGLAGMTEGIARVSEKGRLDG